MKNISNQKFLKIITVRINLKKFLVRQRSGKKNRLLRKKFKIETIRKFFFEDIFSLFSFHLFHFISSFFFQPILFSFPFLFRVVCTFANFSFTVFTHKYV